MTGVTFAQMPCIFIFSGICFVFIMLLGDACQSYGGIVMQYADGRGDGLCTAVGHSGTLNDCVLMNSTVLSEAYDDASVNSDRLVLQAVVSANLRNILVQVLQNCPAGTHVLSLCVCGTS
jgi:hypothetical protein